MKTDEELSPVPIGTRTAFDPRARQPLNLQAVTGTQAASILAEAEIKDDYAQALNALKLFRENPAFLLDDEKLAVVAVSGEGRTAGEIAKSFRRRGLGFCLAGATTARNIASFDVNDFKEALNGSPLAFFGTDTGASNFTLLRSHLGKITSEILPLSSPTKKLFVAIVACRPEEIAAEPVAS